MLTVEADGPVLRLTLARPEVRNALNAELILRLREEFEMVSDAIRVIVLTGEGSAFCSGADLEWMRGGAAATENENYRDAMEAARLFRAIARCRAAVIARVNGHCFGGGGGILAGADVGVASKRALFSFSEVKLGLVPATIGPFVMNKIGRGHARALFSTGEVFNAEKAFRVGLVHEIAEPEGLDAMVAEKVKLFLNAGPEAVSIVKGMTQDEDLTGEESARLLASIRAGSEAREGIDAFLNKRKPSYAVGG